MGFKFLANWLQITRSWKNEEKWTVLTLSREDKGDREGIPHTHPNP